MFSDIEFYCSYPVCMALKKDGYDRWGGSIYTHAVRYNGKDIDFETELDLKFEGKAKLIKRIPGESISFFNEKNSVLDSYGAKKDCVRVSQACAMEWLRTKHKVHISVDTVDAWNEDGDNYDRSWSAAIIDYSKKYSSKNIGTINSCSSYEEAVEKALMKYYNVKPRKKSKQDA